MKRTKLTSYKNCTEARLHNRRIRTMVLKNGEIGIRFDIKDDKDEPRSIHIYKRGITSTLLKLSRESAECLYTILREELNR